MIVSAGSLIFSAPTVFFTLFIAVGLALLLGVTFHEFSHSMVAHRLGDNTSSRLGRMSLNPKVHLDPMGTMMVLLVGFGWGKPVPVNPSRLRGGRYGEAAVSAAGPISNLILACLFSFPFRMGWIDVPLTMYPPSIFEPTFFISYLLYVGLTLNLVLAIFNLLPFAPLDGSALLAGIAPKNWLHIVSKVQMAGPIILITVIVLDFLLGYRIVSQIIGPPVDWMTWLLIG